MKTEDCRRFDATLRRIQRAPGTAVPDDLALHLDLCAACRKQFDTRKVEFDADTFELLPPAARQQIVDRLAGARRPPIRWFAVASVAAALVLVAVGVWFVADRTASAPPVAPAAIVIALVDDHVRYLNHPDRQTTADPTTMGAYLESYVDFPVALPVPSELTFSGARRCMLLDRRATLAFYYTAAGPVSYFILPDDGIALDASPCAGTPEFACLTRGGYHVVHWRDAGLLHAVVGAEPASLLALARACDGDPVMDQPGHGS